MHRKTDKMKRPIIFCLISIYLLISVPGSLFSQNKIFITETSNFNLTIKDELIPYRLFSIFILPAEKFTVKNNNHDQQIHLIFNSGTIRHLNDNEWECIPPDIPGIYSIKIYHPETKDSVYINCVVMVPAKQIIDGFLNGYHIGTYPKIPLKNLPIYKPPAGFIEVTKENENIYLSPHFQLKQFTCKQKSSYPKYTVLKERLISKLEFLLEQVNISGIHCSTFAILSGYRTPYYNHLIGNVKYSRHIYGGAADIFIDEYPKDNMMDDLNRDGKIDFMDAKVLYKLIDSLYGKSFYERFIGGLGRYKKVKTHGPFVHVDVRGFRARWGI